MPFSSPMVARSNKTLHKRINLSLSLSPVTVPPGFPNGSDGKASSCNAGDEGDTGSALGQEDPLEEEVAAHSSVLAWEIPWTEEPGRLQSMRSLRV